MRSVKGSHSEAGLKRLYAAEKGLPLRTAQDHAKKRHPDYIAFLARTGSRALANPDAPPIERRALAAHLSSAPSVPEVEAHVAPAAMTKAEKDWTPEEYAECQAWRGMVEAHRQRDLALRGGDPMVAVGFVKIAEGALKAYHLARQKRVASEIEAGRLKPVAAWQSAKTAVLKVVALLAGLEGELAQVCNPSDPIFARRSISDWKDRKWNPAVRAVIDELDAGLAA